MSTIRETFKQWLEAIDPESCAGFKNTARNCPLARFFSAKCGQPVLAGAHEISTTREDDLSSEPESWMVDFISAIDVLPDTDGVSAAKALQVLAKVRQ